MVDASWLRRMRCLRSLPIRLLSSFAVAGLGISLLLFAWSSTSAGPALVVLGLSLVLTLWQRAYDAGAAVIPVADEVQRLQSEVSRMKAKLALLETEHSP